MPNLIKRFSVTALTCLLSFFLILQYCLHETLPVPASGVIYVVEKGMSLKQVANDMHAKGLMPHPRIFEIFARLKGEGSSLHAGEYFLPPSMNLSQLLMKMVRGEVVQHALRINEGWTWADILAAVQANPYLVKTLDYTASPHVIAQKLGLSEKSPEGLFFPDTYYFSRGESDVDFLGRAHHALQIYLERAWAKRANNLPYKSSYEALIAASIIEKETSVINERPEVSGVIVRRLQKKMRLQMDPTVIYGLGESYTYPLKKVDLQKKTPYNTYLNYNLPPTPIAVPSASSIQAAMRPNKGTSLYFVAKGDGGHYFSSTLNEHNKAVERYINNPVKNTAQNAIKKNKNILTEEDDFWGTDNTVSWEPYER